MCCVNNAELYSAATQMKAYIVLHGETVVFVATCGTDAHLISKRLPGSRIVECHLNSSTEEGSAMLAAPM